MEFQTRPKDVIFKYECNYKENVQDFSFIIDELLKKYPENKEYIYKSIGVKENQVKNATFNRKNFRNALDIYLKETSKNSISNLINDLIKKHQYDKEYVCSTIGINESDLDDIDFCFTDEHMRNALYLKEMARC